MELARRAGEPSRADEYAARARGLVEDLAASIAEPRLRGHFRAMGELLAADPLAAYR